MFAKNFWDHKRIPKHIQTLHPNFIESFEKDDVKNDEISQIYTLYVNKEQSMANGEIIDESNMCDYYGNVGCYDLENMYHCHGLLLLHNSNTINNGNNAAHTNTQIEATESVQDIQNVVSTSNSLLSPNFEGLWSVSWIKSDNSLKTKILSTFSQFILLFAWVFGYVFVMFDLLLLFYFHSYSWFIFLTSILFIPSYIFRIGRSPFWCRILMNGAKYFEGGCSWSFEYAYELSPKIHFTYANELRLPEMFAYHPHGVFTLGCVFNGGMRLSAATDKFMKPHERAKLVGSKLSNVCVFARHGMAAKELVWAPLFRHLIVDMCGVVCSSSKEHFLGFMERNIAFGITVGGFFEVGLFERGVDSIYIKNKKGFIKYALRYGYKIFPAYTFGECETYFNAKDLISREWKHFLSDWHIPPALLIHGAYWWIPFLPYWKGVGLHTIIGKAIECPKLGSKVTQEDIDKYHKLYCEEVIGIYDRNKWRFGYQNKQLQVH